jgi:hypothetical protein
MSQVYSTRFIATQGLSGTGVSVTVPAGLVYVVKQVTIYIDPAFGVTRAFFEDDTSGAALFTGQQTIGNPEMFGLYGALVFEAGQGFHFQVDASPGDGADVYAGGYVLSV